MKRLYIFVIAILCFSNTTDLFAQATPPETKFKYEEFEGKIPDDYEFTYGEEDGETVILITEESTIYDYIAKYEVDITSLDPTNDNYLFWVDKINYDKTLTRPENDVILDFLRAMRFAVFEQ